MKQIIPPQHTGAASDTVHRISTSNDENAKTLFKKARKNLLNVNSWRYLSGKLSATFELIDADGKQVYTLPQQGYYFKIDVPGPGSEEIKGYDWVQIEAIEEELEHAEHNYTAIRVRPSESPEGFENACRHFFTEDATSTFCVERKGREVSAAVYGRNEKPNTKSEGLFSKIRNAVIGLLAMVGLNKPQWAALVKGILEKDADAITFQQ